MSLLLNTMIKYLKFVMIFYHHLVEVQCQMIWLKLKYIMSSQFLKYLI
ncbi:hypothetical protein LEQ41_07220 [Streptococcus agalactiae]|nr:hypothetical protein [Streptococcus agalactiae]